MPELIYPPELIETTPVSVTGAPVLYKLRVGHYRIPDEILHDEQRKR